MQISDGTTIKWLVHCIYAHYTKVIGADSHHTHTILSLLIRFRYRQVISWPNTHSCSRRVYNKGILNKGLKKCLLTQVRLSIIYRVYKMLRLTQIKPTPWFLCLFLGLLTYKRLPTIRAGIFKWHRAIQIHTTHTEQTTFQLIGTLDASYDSETIINHDHITHTHTYIIHNIRIRCIVIILIARDYHSTVLQINEKDMDTNIVYSYSLFLTALANT